jgi:hypothetical protein
LNEKIGINLVGFNQAKDNRQLQFITFFLSRFNHYLTSTQMNLQSEQKTEIKRREKSLLLVRIALETGDGR